MSQASPILLGKNVGIWWGETMGIPIQKVFQIRPIKASPTAALCHEKSPSYGTLGFL